MHNKLLFLKPTEYETEYRLCIPNVTHVREDIIKLHHDSPLHGHRDCDTTYLDIRKHCYWPNMRKHVMKYVKTCDKCLKHKSLHKKPAGFLQPIEHPAAKPWHDVSTDFAVHLPPSRQRLTGITYDAIQIYVCRLTRKLRLIACKTTDTAEEAADRYYLQVFPVEGIPKSIISDRDPKFTGKFWQQLGRNLGVKLKMSSAHRPQTDGQSENAVKITKMLIRIFVNYSQDDWVDYLPMFEFCLNRGRVRGRGGTDKRNVTPFLLSNGYNPISVDDIAIPKPKDFGLDNEVSAADNSNTQVSELDFLKRRKIALAHAQDAIIAGQDRIAEIYNKSRRIVQYKVDDLILIDKNHINPPETRELRSFKLRPKWCGPYKVIQVIGSNAVRVQLPASMQKHPVFNIESTKPYPFEALERARTTQSTQVAGEQEWYVEAILDTKINKRKRLWLVQWKGVDTSLIEEGDQTWEPIQSFESESGVYNIHLVEFEQARTGLIDSHEYDWSYPISPTTPGEVVKQTDRNKHTVYSTQYRDTIQSIAKQHNLDQNKLLMQNTLKYPTATLHSFFKQGTQLRFPNKAQHIVSTMFAYTRQ